MSSIGINTSALNFTGASKLGTNLVPSLPVHHNRYLVPTPGTNTSKLGTNMVQNSLTNLLKYQ